MSDTIHIQISGPDKAGKGLTLALIAHALERAGLRVSVQGAETHNHPKLSRSDEQLAARLLEKCPSIVITELQTTPTRPAPAAPAAASEPPSA